MSDRDALVYIYEMTQGHPSGWLKQLFWESERRCGEWYGIEVDEEESSKLHQIPMNRLKAIVSICIEQNSDSGAIYDNNEFCLITEEQAQNAARLSNEMGLATSPSGAAGLAALLANPDKDASSLVFFTEGSVN